MRAIGRTSSRRRAAQRRNSAVATRRPRQAHPRGFALLMVLWIVALLALLGTRLVANGRSETRIAATLRDSAVAEAAADGAIPAAVFHLLAPAPQGWAVDGQPHRLRLGAAEVVVRITDERWKVPLNGAPVALLQALLQELGTDAHSAAALAQRMQDWRSDADAAAHLLPYRAAGRAWGPPGAPFRSIDDLALLLGMTPPLLQRLRPHVTVFAEGLPAATTPDATVARALARLAEAGMQLAAVDGPRVLRIRADSRSGGARFRREAVVRLVPDGAAPYRVLDWRLAAEGG